MIRLSLPRKVIFSCFSFRMCCFSFKNNSSPSFVEMFLVFDLLPFCSLSKLHFQMRNVSATWQPFRLAQGSLRHTLRKSRVRNSWSTKQRLVQRRDFWRGQETAALNESSLCDLAHSHPRLLRVSRIRHTTCNTDHASPSLDLDKEGFLSMTT